MDAFVRVRGRFLVEPWPAQTAVGVAELGVPGALIELRAIACRTHGRRSSDAGGKWMRSRSSWTRTGS